MEKQSEQHKNANVHSHKCSALRSSTDSKHCSLHEDFSSWFGSSSCTFSPHMSSVLQRLCNRKEKKWDEISTGCNSWLMSLSAQNATEFNFRQSIDTGPWLVNSSGWTWWEEESESRLRLGLILDCINTPTGLSCSGWVRLPSACLPGLLAGICRSCHGWRGDRAPQAPERNPQGPHRPSTPARRCSRTRTGYPHLQDLKGKYKKSDRVALCSTALDVLSLLKRRFVSEVGAEKEQGLNQSCHSGYTLTFNMVGPITELQGENVIDRSAGVQCVGVLVVADESVLSS